jgi:hypothetical protein
MTIERIRRPVPTRFLPARLYVDDIQEIIDLFEKEAKTHGNVEEATHTTITVEDKKCDQVDDLLHLGVRETRTLEVDVEKMGVQLRFRTTTFSTEWTSYGLPYDKAWAIYHRLEDILDERAYKWRRLCRALTAGSRDAVWLVLAIISGASLTWNFKTMTAPIVRDALVVPYFFLFAIVLAGTRQNSTVVFRRYSDHAAARRDFKEKMIPDLIKIGIGFGLGLLAEYIKHKLWP